MFANGKFGAERIFIVVPGSPGYLIDLEHEIRREMQEDFADSKAVGWNENYDYYLDGGAPGSWTIDKLGRVIVDCGGDDNPRQHSGLSWKGHFKGLFDIRGEKFVAKEYKRVFCGKYAAQ